MAIIHVDHGFPPAPPKGAAMSSVGLAASAATLKEKSDGRPVCIGCANLLPHEKLLSGQGFSILRYNRDCFWWAGSKFVGTCPWSVSRTSIDSACCCTLQRFIKSSKRKMHSFISTQSYLSGIVGQFRLRLWPAWPCA